MRWAFGLYGAGGMGRALMAFIPESLPMAQHDRLTHTAFIDSGDLPDRVNGDLCLSEDAFFALDADAYAFNVSIADSRIRQRLFEQVCRVGAVPWSIKHPSAVIGSHNDIASGAVFCAFTTVTANVRIGEMFQCNLYSYVEHDCVIGDYVTFAPGVHCNGNVHIGDHAYIGAGAILRNGTPDKPLVIGEGAVVGMGAVVTKDVAPHTTVVGNPARVMPK